MNDELRENVLTEMERDTLAEIGNISMGSAATALSTVINRKVVITVPEVFVSIPQKINEIYPVPCILVKVEYLAGLEGSNMLVIKEQDAAVIGDLMMGEDGTNPPQVLDELYLSAVTEAMNMMMGSAATAMSDLFARLIDISPPTSEKVDLSSTKFEVHSDVPVAVIMFKIEIDDLVDSTMLQVIELPFAKEMVANLHAQDHVMSKTEEPIEVAQTVSAFTDWADLTEGEATREAAAASEIYLKNINIDLIKNIPVQIRAILGKSNMTINNILKLSPGYIMELDTLDGEPIDVYANDTLIAKGEVVVVGEQFGIRILEITTHEDRISSVK